MVWQSVLPVLTLLAVAGLGQSRVEAAQAVRCTGKVVDTEGRPVDRADVVAFEMLSDGLAGNFTLERVGGFATGNDGAFAFAVPPRPATGTLFISGYVVASREGSALGWAIWNMREDLAVTITLGEPATTEGTVVDEEGKPVIGAQVRANLQKVRQTAAGEEKTDWLPGLARPEWMETRTDGQGRFAFGHVPRDAAIIYLITATGKATIYTQESEQRGQPSILPGRTGVRFVLPKEGRIAGRILDPDTSQAVAQARFAVVPTVSGLMYYRLACTSDPNGAFVVGGLKAGKYLVRGDGLPHTYVEVQSGATAGVTIRTNKAWYGRILFQSGAPAVVKPAPWPGAATMIFLSEREQATGDRVGQLDDEGYFRVYLSQEQYERLQAEKAWFHVHWPYKYDASAKFGKQKWMQETVFAVDLLARDRAKAGAARIPGPAREPISLADKALPPLEALGLSDLEERGANKVILLCFLDMQQRPSRNCLQQLAARASELQAKGIVIAAVQASKVEWAELDQWTKDNNIPLPVGTIPGDEEKTRSAWGVRSLPWLILTDQNHTVTAEGFAVEELAAKVSGGK